MPVVTKYICDGCGKEKGLTNHWWLANNDGSSLLVRPFRSNTDGFRIYCGENCMLAAISKWMQERKEQDTETGKG